MLRAFVTAVIILLARATVADTIVLDDFSTGINAATVSFTGTGASGLQNGNQVLIRKNTRATWTDTRQTAGSMLWDSRSSDFSRGSNNEGSSSLNIGFNLNNSSSLEMGNPNDATAISSQLTYKNAGAATLIDLSAMATFNIDVVALDSPVTATISLRDSSNAVAATSLSLSSLTIGRQSVSLASIFNSIDESRVVQADLTFSLPTGGDIKLQELYFAPVPEPSTLVIASAIAAVVLFRRRQRALRTTVS